MQIDSVNLDIDAGSFIGVVGQSGSGKSTLMKLLPSMNLIKVVSSLMAMI